MTSGCGAWERASSAEVKGTLAESPVNDPSVPRMELAEWASRYGLVAGLTTRERGFSLGLWSAEAVGQVLGRWRAFRSCFASRFPATVLSHQVHGNAVGWQEGVPPGWLILDGLDGHATADQGVLLTITVADCIPVYVTVPGKAVALLHAGWRGVAAGVLERGLEVVRRHIAAPPAEIVMHCGVGICGACYEVGSEVAEQLGEKRAEGKVQVDLRALLARRAQSLGVELVTVSPWCTAHDRTRFFSHRASGGADGRMVAYLGLPIA